MSIGLSLPRADGAEKLSGRATYTADIALPGMLHGKLLLLFGVAGGAETRRISHSPGQNL